MYLIDTIYEVLELYMTLVRKSKKDWFLLLLNIGVFTLNVCYIIKLGNKNYKTPLKQAIILTFIAITKNNWQRGKTQIFIPLAG